VSPRVLAAVGRCSLRRAQKNAGKSIGEATLSRVATTLLDALDCSDQDVAEEAAATLGVFAMVASVADVDAIVAVLAPPVRARLPPSLETSPRLSSAERRSVSHSTQLPKRTLRFPFDTPHDAASAP
jgi:hypothetical protein